ncbi:CinA family protein [Rhodococcus koreensis]|uniref:CinA family protein n=1 Tax=Rhodococcus koreensis TaxID=99653 RepID=UPI00366A7D4F
MSAHSIASVGARRVSSCAERAERISTRARDRHLTIATAESLTGGRISCVLGAASSASEWYRGSIVGHADLHGGQMRRHAHVPVDHRRIGKHEQVPVGPSTARDRRRSSVPVDCVCRRLRVPHPVNPTAGFRR